MIEMVKQRCDLVPASCWYVLRGAQPPCDGRGRENPRKQQNIKKWRKYGERNTFLACYKWRLNETPAQFTFFFFFYILRLWIKGWCHWPVESFKENAPPSHVPYLDTTLASIIVHHTWMGADYFAIIPRPQQIFWFGVSRRTEGRLRMHPHTPCSRDVTSWLKRHCSNWLQVNKQMMFWWQAGTNDGIAGNDINVKAGDLLSIACIMSRLGE